ncbi:MAG: class I SAM-dependent methyltransferase, partial [Nocardioides sp.]
MTSQSLVEAKEATDLLASYVPDLGECRVADLGCGVGRHLASLAQHTSDLVGVEASPLLAPLAAKLVPESRVEVASFHDLAELGAFDVVCAFSHILMLTDGHEGVLGNLQLIRGAMPDYGLLVVEVMPVAPGALEWHGPDGTTVAEERAATPGGLRHQFRIKSTAGGWFTELPSAIVTPSAWPALAEAGGFLVEAVEPFLYSDGTSSTFYFLRAQKGYNFLSDLGEFLESWA